MPADPQSQLLTELSLLYELSLSIGRSLDLRDNCDRFLGTMMARKNLACAVVWWRRESGGALEAVYANPAGVCDGAVSEPEIELPLENWTEAPSGFAELAFEGGRTPQRMVLFPLGTRGVLLLGSHRKTALEPVECNQLRALLGKFAVSLDACVAHERLSAAEARNQQLALVARHTDNAVLITDAKQRILWANAGFTRLTGWGLDEVVGRVPGHFLQGPETDGRTVASIREAIAADRSITAEILNYHRDRQTYWVSMSINPIVGEQGETTGYIAVERDVTAERMQRDLMQAQTGALEAARVAAEEASKAKSRFVAEMSHEFRTPLAAILGLGDVLEERVADSGRLVLQQLHQNAAHLLDLVNGVLDLASIEAGRLEVGSDEIDLPKLVAEVREIVAPRAARTRLELRMPGRADLPATLNTDARRLRQILVNLLDNGVKYTKRGHVELRIHASRRSVVFEVEDTGIGIPSGQLEHLFEPFVRIEGSGIKDGRGLGLSLAREFARALGGDLTVESTPGRGSCFTLTLPLRKEGDREAGRGATRYEVAAQPDRGEAVVASDPAAATAGSADAESSGPPRLQGLRILAAEDTAELRDILAFYLEPTGAALKFASDGQEAVDAVADAERAGRPFEVILMDVQMPVLDGLGATAALRESGYRGHITAVTAYALAEDRERCFAAGCDDWLGKPLDPDSLYELLRRVAAERPAVDPEN